MGGEVTLRSALEYKEHWRGVFEQCDRLGRPRPEPVPHPYDVHIDADAGLVDIRGPRTPEERAQWLDMVSYVAGAEALLTAIASGEVETRGAEPAQGLHPEALRRRVDALKAKLPARWQKAINEAHSANRLGGEQAKEDEDNVL